MSWLSTALPGQQTTGNQQPSFLPSSNQYIINSNQDNYLQSLANFHQSSTTHPSFQPQYWSAVPTAVMFPAPPQTMLTQQQQLNNEPQSPQSKSNNTNNVNRSMTPPTANDILNTSQSNQQQTQFINMSRTAQTPGI